MMLRRVLAAWSNLPVAWAGRLVLGLSAVGPFAVALALVPVRDHVSGATVALALAAAVALLAAVGTRPSAVAAAVSAGLGFDVFHTRPYGSIAITRAQDAQTTALLLCVGVVVGQLAVRNRRNRQLAAEARYDLGRIHAVAEMVSAGAPAQQTVLAVSNELVDLLGLRSCHFDETFADPPGPFIERFGGVSWGALRWGVGSMGLPGHEVSLIVQHQGRPLGRYVLQPQPGGRVTPDQLLAAVALADQAGAALAAQDTPA